MGEIFSQVHFVRPFFFVLVAFLPLFWLRWRYHRKWFILWRSFVFLLLVLALADPQWIREVKRIKTRAKQMVAFDLSRSIPKAMRRWMLAVAREELKVSPEDPVFVFAGGTKEVRNWDQWLSGLVSYESIGPDKTNLEGLFTKLSSKLSRTPDAYKKVYLFTDGWETEGRVASLLSFLALSSLEVYPLVPDEPLPVANVALKRILAPQRGDGGEGVHLRVVVENQGTRAVRGELTLRRGDQTLKVEPVTINPGSQLFSFKATLPEKGLTSFQASFVPLEAETDLFSHDNQATAWVSVVPKGKILILNGRRGQGRILEGILKRMGFQTTSVVVQGASPAPNPYQAVIFNDTPREKFSPDYLESVERYVAGGGSLIMLGGSGSFGPGGYRGTPIEAALPVRLMEPVKKEKRRAIVLVMDKSGSMRREEKLLYAKEAVKALADSLMDRDLIGVVGFDLSPFVVVPLRPLEQVRSLLATQVDRLKAGGKTYLYPALAEARNQLERIEASSKHLIVLSDGETGGTGSNYIDLVSVMKEKLKITVSTVAIGDHANIPLLRRIAQYGGGLFHHTYDPKTLPQIVLQQVREQPLDKTNKKVVELKTRLLPGSRLFSKFPERFLPPVYGYIETEVKEEARLDVLTEDGEKEAPFLASWRYGKGRALAFAADLEGGWTKEWIQWPALQKFWQQAFDWLVPAEDPLPPYEVRINVVEGRPILDLYLYGKETAASNFRYSYGGNGKRGEGVLDRVTIGHYRTPLRFSTPGDYRIELVEERAEKRLPYPPLGYTLSFDAGMEIPRDHVNTALLERLARATGGAINPPLGIPLETQELVEISQSLRFYPMVAALLFFLFEIFLRRWAPWGASKIR